MKKNIKSETISTSSKPELIDFGENFVVLSEPKVESEMSKSKNTIDAVVKSIVPNEENTLDTDFEVKSEDTLTDSEIDFDPKLLYSKSLQTKRKPAIYSTFRTFLMLGGLFLFVLFSALSIAYNISEFENPDLGAKEIISEITEVINPGTDQPNVNVQRPAFSDNNPNRLLRLPPEIAQKIQQRREANLASRILGISFEFVVIASILTLLSYLIYRHTDWPFVKNKLLLAFLIILVSVIISLGFLMLFRQDNRIPRALRGHRDNWRSKMINRQQISSQNLNSFDDILH
jgi:hypothetical protein